MDQFLSDLLAQNWFHRRKRHPAQRLCGMRADICSACLFQKRTDLFGWFLVTAVSDRIQQDVTLGGVARGMKTRTQLLPHQLGQLWFCRACDATAHQRKGERTWRLRDRPHLPCILLSSTNAETVCCDGFGNILKGLLPRASGFAILTAIVHRLGQRFFRRQRSGTFQRQKQSRVQLRRDRSTANPRQQLVYLLRMSSQIAGKPFSC